MGAGKISAGLQRRPHSLPGHLYYAEPAYRQYFRAGPVGLGGGAEGPFDFLSMPGVSAVDKIAHYQAAEVPQFELASNLRGSLDIFLVCRLLLEKKKNRLTDHFAHQ